MFQLYERFNCYDNYEPEIQLILFFTIAEVYHDTGQMVDFADTERMDYDKALEIAQTKGDDAIIKKLTANGRPPYYGNDVTWKSAVYLNYLNVYMANNPEIHNPGYNTIRDICSSEYGLLDKINFFRGIINTYNHVYQKLYAIDLRKDYTKLDVPVYLSLAGMMSMRLLYWQKNICRHWMRQIKELYGLNIPVTVHG